MALYAAVVFLVLFWAVMFSSINGSLQVEIEAKSQLLEGMQRRGASVKTGADATQFAVISAPSETVAASTLQQYLLDRLEQAGGSVQRVQAATGRDAKSDGMRRVTAEIEFDAVERRLAASPLRSRDRDAVRVRRHAVHKTSFALRDRQDGDKP